MKKHVLFFVIMMFAGASAAFAHCQVPCGIFGDDLRFSMMFEHVETIEKAMNQINSLSKEGDKNYNQIVRWVNTKEDHAKQLGEIAVQYFLYQRIKVKEKGSEGYEDYQKSLNLLHRIIVLTMKSKQSTDVSVTGKLKELIHTFQHHYTKK